MPVFKINLFFIVLLVFFWWFASGTHFLAAFSLVVMHELVHAIVAALKGFEISQIEILPFGGAAEYSGLLEMYPSVEMLVALAGPLSNMILLPLFYFLELDIFLKYSLVLALFNLVPLLPLDGGRVLRSILVRKRGFKRGTEAVVTFSRIGAVVLFLTGLVMIAVNYLSVVFIITAIFIYYAAFRENEQFYYRLLSYLVLRKNKPEDFDLKEIFARVVVKEFPVEELILQLSPEKYNVFYVVDGKYNIISVLSETSLLDAFFSLQESNLRLVDILEESDYEC